MRRRIAHAEEGELLLQHRQRQIDPQRGQQRLQPRPGGEDHPVSLIRAARGAYRHTVAIGRDLDHRLLVMQLRPLGTGPRGERGHAATGGEDAVVLLVDADRPFREGVLRVAAAQLVGVEPLVGHAERVERASHLLHRVGVRHANVHAVRAQQQRLARFGLQLVPEPECLLSKLDILGSRVGDPDHARGPVRAALLVAEGELLQQADAMPGPRQPPGRRAAHRPTAHDDHIHCPFRRHTFSYLNHRVPEIMEQRARLRHSVRRPSNRAIADEVGVIPRNWFQNSFVDNRHIASVTGSRNQVVSAGNAAE